MKKPLFLTTGDQTTDKNFLELTRVFSGMFNGADAKLMSAALVTGDNAIVPSVAKPQGRIITYQDAASTLFDKGLINGHWVINASAPCNIRLAFF